MARPSRTGGKVSAQKTRKVSSVEGRSKSVDVRQVGRELGLRYVLEGSVRKAGNRVRITAQLNDAGDGHHVWAERYDRALEDIFAVQDEITQSIIGAIAPRRAQRSRNLMCGLWAREPNFDRFARATAGEARKKDVA